jgi:hypothetical protein
MQNRFAETMQASQQRSRILLKTSLDAVFSNLKIRDPPIALRFHTL